MKFITIIFFIVSFLNAETIQTEAKVLNSENTIIELKLDNIPSFKLISTPKDKLSAHEYFLIFTPITTIIIVLVGFFITRLQINKKTEESMNSFNENNRKQMELSKIELLSKNRQTWINTLRDEISKYLTVSYDILRYRNSKDNNDDEINLKVKELQEHEFKIKLLINPNEAKHNLLIELIDENISNLNLRRSIESTINKIVPISQEILKEEWERVKKLK